MTTRRARAAYIAAAMTWLSSPSASAQTITPDLSVSELPVTTVAIRTLPALPVAPRVDVGGGAPLSLAEVLRSVERHHPTLEAARARARAAEGTLMSAEGAFDPALSASASITPEGYYRYGQADAYLTQATPLWGARVEGGWRIGRGLEGAGIPDYYGERETLDGGELRLGVRVPVLQGGPIDSARAGIWRAGHARDAAEASVAASRLSLGLTAASAYQRWVAAGAKARVAQELMQLAEARDAQIRSRVAAGALAPIEHLENRRAILERRQGLVLAIRALEQASIALSFYLRDSSGAPRVADPARVPETLPAPRSDVPEEERALRVAAERRPELTRYRSLLRAADVSVEQSENQLLPRLDLLMGASVDIGGGAADAGDQSRLGTPVFSAGAVLSIPLALREARGLTDQRRAERSALEAEAQVAAERVAIEVRDALSALRAALERLALAAASAEVAEQVAQAERTRFDSGATTLLIVNIREASAASARASLADARADAAIAEAYLQAATGGGEL